MPSFGYVPYVVFVSNQSANLKALSRPGFARNAYLGTSVEISSHGAGVPQSYARLSDWIFSGSSSLGTDPDEVKFCFELRLTWGGGGTLGDSFE